jgi:ribosomal protein S18 acetylase RimI-like enzyme
MRIRRATLNDVSIVAQIHTLAFPGFFLTTLGYSFLRELYSGFVNQPGGIFVVAEDGDKVVGFAAGTTVPDVFFAELRNKRGFYFLLKAIPALIKNARVVFKKLASSIFYKGDKPAELIGGTLLSSIGVIPTSRGGLVGSELLDDFEKIAFSQNATFIYLTTDAVGNERANAFYSKRGYTVEGKFLQQSNRPMLRYVKFNPK